MNLDLDTLRINNANRASEWHHGDVNGQTSLEFKAMELGGEVGEVLNACKKLVRHRNGMVGGVDESDSIEAITDELADVIICVDLIAMELGINLSVAVVNKFNKTSWKMGLQTRLDA